MLIIIFFAGLITSIIAGSGGNGLLLIPILMLLGFKVSHFIPAIRFCALVFTIGSILTMFFHHKKLYFISKKDLSMLGISMMSAIGTALIMHHATMLYVRISLISIFILMLFLTILPPNRLANVLLKQAAWLRSILAFFAGVCGATVGGAGIVLTQMYMHCDGLTASEAMQKRLWPSMFIQLAACTTFLTAHNFLSDQITWVLVIATIIGSYISMRFIVINKNIAKIIVLSSIIFGIIVLAYPF
jgi:uncharacterized membrane protein YfcA